MADQLNARSWMWTPPPDPEKPNCPYLPGFKVEIKAHVPPPPFGGRFYGRGTRPVVADEWLKSVTQTKHVLSHPPLETRGPPQPHAAELTVMKSLAIGNARGAQLATCSITPKTTGMKPFIAVAKIFDPLYYSFSNALVSLPVDVVRVADGDYSREAAAYEYLQKIGETGLFTPKYFGSWTFTLPITTHSAKTHQRPVRLVLIEHLDGSSMRKLYVQNSPRLGAEPDALHYDEEYRLEVLAKVLDGVVKQRHAGLDQRDLAPRNVILVPSPHDQPWPKQTVPRVVLVDYNNSLVYERTRYGKEGFHISSLPRNPADLYWNESMPEFVGWTPPEWDQNPSLRQEWLLHRFGGSRKSIYEPLSNKLEFTSRRAD
jgi:hypothetical protein